jgi:hypothetical protein
MPDRDKILTEMARALSPLVNDDMDAEMRAAWLNDLAQAAYTIVERRIGELEEALSAARLDLNHLAGGYGEQEFVAPTICRIIASLEQRSDQ